MQLKTARGTSYENFNAKKMNLEKKNSNQFILSDRENKFKRNKSNYLKFRRDSILDFDLNQEQND